MISTLSLSTPLIILIVSVGQKTKGYQNAPGFPFSPELLKALDFVDASLGKVVQRLESVKLLDSTLIIVASKHGQTPIDPTLWKIIDPLTITNGTKVDVDFQTVSLMHHDLPSCNETNDRRKSDDIALLFLKNQHETEEAVENLEKIRAVAKIDDIIWGDRLKSLGFGDPTKDPAVPDIIVKPVLGVCYTTSTKKIAEHGGLSDDDA